MPDLKHQRLVKPLFAHVSTERMHGVLKHMTSYYSRYYGDTFGEKSSEWLHDHIAQVLKYDSMASICCMASIQSIMQTDIDHITDNRRLTLPYSHLA